MDREKSRCEVAPRAMGAQYSVRGCFMAFTLGAYDSAFGPQLQQIWTDLNQTWHKETVPQSNTASHIGRTLRHHAALQLFFSECVAGPFAKFNGTILLRIGP